MSEILAAAKRASNADLIAECHQLGYLNDTDLILDPTWGRGTFWARWKPQHLMATDIDPDKSPTGTSVDFTRLPCGPDRFDAVVLDPPYKLNGTPTHEVDDRYGVAGAYTSVADRHQLIRDGITEATRVLKLGGRLLVKCQDQVNGGKVRWQTDIFTRHAEQLGHRKIDALLYLGHRAQPPGRRQQHARRNYSTLLVFVLEERHPQLRDLASLRIDPPSQRPPLGHEVEHIVQEESAVDRDQGRQEGHQVSHTEDRPDRPGARHYLDAWT